MSFAATRRYLLVLLAIVALLAVATPALAESECVADEAGDVVDRSSNTQVPEAREADILAACTDHTETVLEISVRVANPTDPATDPAWEDFASAVGAAVDTDGDGTEEFDVNYGRFPDGRIGVSVFEHKTPNVQCTADGLFDGVRYRMLIPTSCIGNPGQVSVAAFIFYTSSVAGQEEEGLFDEVPDFPNFRGPFSTAADPDTAVQRLAGLSRVDTAVAVSEDDFADGAAGAVVLARADRFPDALVAAPLAVAANAPLLLTPSFALAQVVEDELQRVLPAGGTVYLSGGEAALSDDVRAEVEALGYTVVRVAGLTRYATSVEVARAADPDPQLIVVADGNDFPDALIGGSLAGHEGGVEIISDGPQLSAEGEAYLAEHPEAEVLAIGSVAAQAVPTATAIAGEDAFATSVAVATQRYADVDGVALASGTNFPDGLAGGAHAGRRGIPLLLSWPDILPGSVAEYLASIEPVSEIYAYGGVAALSYQVEFDAMAALG
ncbi:MAG TPA: cell wall-binding repeat-containing protein [Euzebya sp.]|nr:cell wall-binding repeat-containing protein [Euzebya sp.]